MIATVLHYSFMSLESLLIDFLNIPVQNPPTGALMSAQLHAEIYRRGGGSVHP
jgi:hypothetical protein